MKRQSKILHLAAALLVCLVIRACLGCVATGQVTWDSEFHVNPSEIDKSGVNAGDSEEHQS